VLLLPLGHEEDSVRRVPWITLVVAVICVAALVASTYLGPDPTAGIEESFSRIQAYFLEHPYLELDERVEKVFFRGLSVDEKQALLESWRAMVPGPESAEQFHREQLELDRLCAAALAALSNHPYYAWGLIPSKPSPTTFVTHMFMHGGWLHLIGNLLILYLAGPFIEDKWGRPLYAVFYLTAGLAASGFYVLANLESTTPMIGASGAIAGVMGAFLIRFRSTRIHFFYMIGFIIRGTFAAPAWLMLPLWLAQQIFMGSMTGGSEGGGVAYWAHVGGFVFGMTFATAMARLRIEERFIHPTIDAKVNVQVIDNPALDEAAAAEADGRPADAFGILADALRADPRNRDLALAVWDVGLRHGWTMQAAPAMIHVIGDEVRSSDLDLAAEHWVELASQCADAALDTVSMVRISRHLVEMNRNQDARMTITRALDSRQDATASIEVRLAQLADRIGAPELAARAAESALARPDLHPQERLQAEELCSKAAALRVL